MEPIYSICITNYNTVNSVKISLESILLQIDKKFEIIVVDNQSTDGSLEILREYQKRNQIKLIVTKCSRGFGRQIGVKFSSGKYIISQMDLDDVFKPELDNLIEIYHTYFEGAMLLVSGVPGLMIAPKQLVEKIGGYRDLNYLEDKDLYSRAASIGQFSFLPEFKIIDHSITSKSVTSRILILAKKEYFIFREAYRIGYGFSQLKYFLNDRLLSAKNPLFLIGDFTLAFWGFPTHFFILAIKTIL